jgi:hypothetical protein
MKQNITLSMFRDAFASYSRDNFSYEGYEILFNYFEEADPDMELDVVAIDCGYCESTFEEFAEQYDIEVDEDIEDLDDREEELKSLVIDFVTDQGSLVGVTGSTVVYANF